MQLNIVEVAQMRTNFLLLSFGVFVVRVTVIQILSGHCLQDTFIGLIEKLFMWLELIFVARFVGSDSHEGAENIKRITSVAASDASKES